MCSQLDFGKKLPSFFYLQKGTTSSHDGKMKPNLFWMRGNRRIAMTNNDAEKKNKRSSKRRCARNTSMHYGSLARRRWGQTI